MAGAVLTVVVDGQHRWTSGFDAHPALVLGDDGRAVVIAESKATSSLVGHVLFNNILVGGYSDSRGDSRLSTAVARR